MSTLSPKPIQISSTTRTLLADLSHCAWESLKVFLQDAVDENNSIPGAVIAMQNFGDFGDMMPHRVPKILTATSW